MDLSSKFIYLKRRETFDEIKDLIPVNLNPIIFIEDTSQLYTCGTFFNLGYPDVKVTETSGQVKVDIGQEHFLMSTTGDSLSIRKGDGNKIIISSSALTEIFTESPLKWDDVSKKLTHIESGVIKGNYGQSNNTTNASILNIPNFTVNEHGHIVFAKTTSVQIRDYVTQVAPSDLNAERNILEGYNEANNTSDTDQVRKANGLTFNDSLKRLSVEGGIVSNNSVSVKTGDLVVEKGYIIGKVKGDVEGEATPKIHLSETPEYGGASTELYGHVVLRDDLPGVEPPLSSDNNDSNNTNIIAVAASPRMVWEALKASNKYTDDQLIDIIGLSDDNIIVDIKNSLNFTKDFVVDNDNNLSLRWEELL